MCLIVFAYRKHPVYRLVMAANRDEFYNRPTAPAHFWNDHPDVLAGRDLEKGGTWMGVTKTGRFAAVTNYRDPSSEKADARSRGELVGGYLSGNQSPHDYLKRIQERASSYNGFNLIVGNGDSCFYLSNYEGKIRELKPGIYGLSNALLDVPWPKVESSKQRLVECLDDDLVQTECLFDLLSDTEQAKDSNLPNTGIELDLERLLSSVLIKSRDYGTRSSTVMLIDKDLNVTFTERSLYPQQNEASFSFKIERGT
ncbi:MAG TPA: NRDE family protein [Bacillales bacterium]|nr:NRDE family protein [Bacillales bacterium]